MAKMNLTNRNRLTDIENRFVFVKEERGEGGRNLELTNINYYI